MQNDDPNDPTVVTLTLEMLFAFVTGADHEPPMGFDSRPQIRFDARMDRFLPYSSTCIPALFLPIALSSPDYFRQKMDYAILCTQGFGKP